MNDFKQARAHFYVFAPLFLNKIAMSTHVQIYPQQNGANAETFSVIL